MGRLQIGCVLVSLYMMLVYFSTKREKTRNHIVFSLLMAVAHVLFVSEFVTMYTVNHMEHVPAIVNLAAHKVFLCSIVVFMYLSADYVLQLIDKKVRASKIFGAAMFILTLVLPTTFVETKYGNHSFGPSVICAYLVTFVYLIVCGFYLVRNWQEINKKKRYPVMLALGAQFAVSLAETVNPCIYFISAGFLLIVLSFFLTVESPDVLLIELLRKEKKRADDANQAKSDFLARMSHEIRTPIHVIEGMDEMILRESREETVRDYASDIKTATGTLLGLVNDILDLSKIESGKMELIPTEYELPKLIRELVNSVSDAAAKKNLKLELEVTSSLPTALYGDGAKVRQIITNLLTNAVKYTHEGTVILRVSGQQEGENVLLQVEVADTGIGIKEEDIHKLFKAFERIEEKRNQNIEGTGLGINITNEFLHMMGSRLEVSSIYGKGSVFSFRLEQRVVDGAPIGDIQEHLRKNTKDYQYQASFTAPSACVLVVDDNPMNRKVFRGLLKETGVQVEEAESGFECLDKVKKNHYHVIFMDHMMPEMDGVETLHHLRNDKEHLCADTPVVILTANAVEGAKEWYLQEGFDAYLKKPIVPYKLERMLQQLLPKELLQEGAKNRYGDVRKEIVLPDIEGVNYQHAGLYTQDENMILDAMRVFYEGIGEVCEELQGYYRQINEAQWCDRFRIRVHSLKTNAALVGILSVSELARLLEYAAREGNIGRIDALLPVLLQEMELYGSRLAPLFGKQEQAPRGDLGELLARVEMIRVSMINFELDTADMLCDEISRYTYEEPYAEKICELLKSVGAMDTETAVQVAEELVVKIAEGLKGDNK